MGRWVSPFPATFGRCSWGSWPTPWPVHSWPHLSPVSTWCLAFVSCQLGGFHSSLLPVTACGWEGEWTALCSFQWCGVFGYNGSSGKRVSLSFKWLQQNECDSGFPSWHEHLPSYILFWKISIFALPWSSSAFKAFYALLLGFPHILIWTNDPS